MFFIKVSKMILSLDLGTKTGWAILSTENRIASGTHNFATTRFDGGGVRFVRFRQWLSEFYKQTEFNRVVFEEVRAHAGVDASHMYGGFLATLTAWCEIKNIPYEGVGVGTIKKSITGKGNASKMEVIKAVKEKGFEPIDDNEADAIALLLHVAKPSFIKILG